MTAMKTASTILAREVAEGDALAVLLQDREHQDPVSGVANDGHQPEDRADGQHHAVRGNRGKVIRRTKNGLDESVPTMPTTNPARYTTPTTLAVVRYRFWPDWPRGPRCA